MRHILSLDAEYDLLRQTCDRCQLDLDALRPDGEVDDTHWYPQELFSIIEAFYKYRLGIITDPPCIWLVVNALPTQQYHDLVYELRTLVNHKMTLVFPQWVPYYRYSVETNLSGRLYIRTLGIDPQRLKDTHDALDDVYDPFDAD